MNESKNTLFLQQTLHGYADGHRLLKKSFEIPYEYKKTILILSDLSGPAMVSGFEEYITGYPLKKMGYYAIAKTWYADEMKRPGCVWTHTLYIPEKALLRLNDMSILLKYFKRPDNNFNHSYEIPIVIDLGYKTTQRNNTFNVDRFPVTPEKIKKVILFKFYSNPEKSILLPINSNKDIEKFVLAMFSQQWPNLKLSICFSTGSLSNRKLNGKSFDLQIIPSSKINQFLNKSLEFEVVEDGNLRETNFEWLNNAYDDLIYENSLREFLWKYGQDVINHRKSFIPLINIFTKLDYSEINDTTLEYIAKSFPESNNAVLLKVFIFGDSRTNKKLFLSKDQKSVIKFLLYTKHHRAFDPKDLNIEKRAKDLWLNERETIKELVKLLLKHNLNSLNIVFLKGVSSVIKTTDLLEITNSNPSKVSIFIKINPKIAYSSELWNMDPDFQRELFYNIKSLKRISKSQWKFIQFAILNNDTDIIVDDVLTTLGQSGYSNVLDWITFEKNKNKKLFLGWERSLIKNQNKIIDWLRLNRPLNLKKLAMISDLLDPNLKEFSESKNLGEWFNLGIIELKNLSESEKLQLSAFLLTLGLNNKSEKSSKLVAMTFEPVHEALYYDNLPFSSWNRIERHLPSLNIWNEWDKCEKLRRGLLEHFSDNEWSSQDFISSVTKKETFKKIIKYGKKKSKYRKYIKKVRNDVLIKNIILNDIHKEILFYNFDN